MNLNIVIADDHGLIRDGLSKLITEIQGITVVGVARNGREAVEIAKKLKPDVILMDIAMPELNGIEATRQITAEQKGIKIIMVSMYSTDEYVLDSIRAGAHGYLLKNAGILELETAITTVMNDATYLSPSISKYLTEFIRNPNTAGPEHRLTSRQREILQLIAEGFATSQIAAKLHITQSTVEKHRINLMQELQIHNIPDLVKFAIRKGIVSLET